MGYRQLRIPQSHLQLEIEKEMITTEGKVAQDVQAEWPSTFNFERDIPVRSQKRNTTMLCLA